MRILTLSAQRIYRFRCWLQGYFWNSWTQGDLIELLFFLLSKKLLKELQLFPRPHASLFSCPMYIQQYHGKTQRIKDKFLTEGGGLFKQQRIYLSSYFWGTQNFLPNEVFESASFIDEITIFLDLWKQCHPYLILFHRCFGSPWLRPFLDHFRSSGPFSLMVGLTQRVKNFIFDKYLPRNWL